MDAGFPNARGRRATIAAILPLVAALGVVPAGATTTPDLPGWGLDRIDQRSLPLDDSYAPGGDGTGVTVYLVDTGLETGNAEFGDRASLGVNLTGTSVMDCPDEFGVSHGTFVAGIVGGTRTGVAPAAHLVEVQSLGCREGGATMTVRQERRATVRAAAWIRKHAVRPSVVNMSLRFHRSAKIDRAVRRLVRSGIPVVAAAGNDSANACRYSPAHLPAVITVAASTRRERPWHGSNRGPCVDLWAPGKSITSVVPDVGILHYVGSGATSWATPFVTGAVALYLQSNPAATPAAVRRWLRTNATPDALTGVGRRTPNRLLYVGAP